VTVRLAILSSHPIQYNAPAFRRLAAEPGLDVKVFYEWPGTAAAIDSEFGRSVEWDIPLLEGYAYTILPNTARHPGTYSFFGIDNPGVVHAISEWRPDVLLVYGWSFASHVRVLRAFHGHVPILFRGDSTLLDPMPALRRFGRKLVLKWVYRHVDVALFVGARNRDYYLEYGVPESHLVWAPHHVDNERFERDHDGKNEKAHRWRESLNIKPSATVFLFAAKLTPGKAPDLMLDAFVRVRESAPGLDAHLVVVGDGALRETLAQRARGRPDVHLLGFQNQAVMPVVYRLGNVLVLPSLSETWGLSVNEAMACHRGAIVSDRVGCAVDLVHPGRNGLHVETASLESLAGALGSVVGDSARLKAWGRESHRLIQGWSIHEFARIVADVARQVASLQGM